MAYIATSRHDDALDIVQDTMFTLVKSYADKTAEEWPGLFFRILQNKIRDNYRRQSVMSKLFFWQNNTSDYDADIVNKTGSTEAKPEELIQNQQLGEEIDLALKQLPLRQQQTFLLRAWQEMSVKQTAEIMQISEGSVKTHYSRALDVLRQSLKSFYCEE